MLNKFREQLADKGDIYLRIKVKPNCSKTQVRELLLQKEGETIKIDIAAPPVKGRANQELVKFLSREFSVIKDKVKLISGVKEKLKLIKITR